MLTKVIGISSLLGKQHFFRLRILVIDNLGIKILVCSLGIILACHHLMPYILRNPKDLGRCQTHIKVIAVNAVLYILKCSGGFNIHFLIVRQNRSARSNMLLTFLTENCHKNIHYGFLLGLILFYLLGNCQLAHRIGKNPVILRFFSKIRKNDAVKSSFIADLICHSCGGTDHRSLALKIWLTRFGKLQFLITRLKTDIL